ncbi:uncharacterized protein isoform X2 [Choristoneura fumiferana]|uniref:uncharacterized protein isoform X2 n=1 Tax=Choristoneura fumiferana TaxID=7141 RepID=UPI003D15B375
MQNALEKRPCQPKIEGGVGADCTHTCPGDGPRCNRSPEQQHGLRSCFVRLERLPVGDLHRGALNWTEVDPCQLQPAGGAGAAPECTHTRPGEGPRCNMSHDQQFQLRSCSVRLERMPMEDLPRCDTCLVIFYCKLSLKSHNCIHSVEESNFCEEACDKTAKMYFECDNCGEQYQKKKHLVKHLAAHSLKTGCDLLLLHSTNDMVSRSQSINRPALASHTGEKPSLYRCDICSNMFNRKQDLLNHVTKVHIHSVAKKPKLFKCDTCEKCFTTQASLTAHNRSHTDEKPFSCDVCNSQFKQRSTLTRHKRVHTGEKPFTCDVCNSQFKQRRCLVVHRRIHTGEKPYTCDFCKLQFRQRSTLTRHKRVHTGEKPFTCDVCNSQFKQRRCLVVHRRIHTGEKPYTCDFCKLQFTQRISLVGHRRIHTGEKPFTCDVCKSRFTHRSNLLAHRRTHTGEKPFTCDVCNSQFKHNCNLTRHKRIHTR